MAKNEKKNKMMRRKSTLSPEEARARIALQKKAARLTASGVRTGVNYEKMETYPTGKKVDGIPEAP